MVTTAGRRGRAGPETSAPRALPPAACRRRPPRTAGTAPISAASAPEFELAELVRGADEHACSRPPTRPRIASGVSSWTRVWRTKTLTMSAAPSTSRAGSDSGRAGRQAEADGGDAEQRHRPEHDAGRHARRSGDAPAASAIATAPTAGIAAQQAQAPRARRAGCRGHRSAAAPSPRRAAPRTGRARWRRG